jgi:transposase
VRPDEAGGYAAGTATRSDSTTSSEGDPVASDRSMPRIARMAVVGIQHNPVIRAHYERKRAAGKSKMNALGHCMRKALSLVWGVWRNGQDFDPDWGVGA